MPEIKNKKYREFLDTGLIDILKKDKFEKILEISGKTYKDPKQARILTILLYYTGRRPSELLELTKNNFERDRRYLKLITKTKKKGKGSVVYLPMNDHIKEVWEYVKNLPPYMFLIWRFKGKSRNIVTYDLKYGGKRRQEYEHSSYKVTYWVKKWSKEALGKPIPPYFFRHNRLSELRLKGADPEELMHFKGSRDLQSVQPYLHLSSKEAKKLAKLMR